ncbi:MAG: DUF503 domain-containing protein [Planctomycetes bacterium]|nr:DUF503 domain-containing protein [Planctomycetota bacterium]
MILATAQIRLDLSDARTLKDKRRTLASLKDQLRAKFNVSVAEVDGLDCIRSATLGVAHVSNDSRYADGTLNKLIDLVRRFPAARLIDYSIEVF